jgi:2-keto-4-pentenoate hydratase/2-oxohepta-3-ene-1,7-dioic acid hydratase in catechol pathway
MKLLRYGQCGVEKPGVLDDDGNIRDLSAFISDLNALTLCNLEWFHQLKGINFHELPLVGGVVRIGACVGMPGKILCVGFNSRMHAQEMGVTPIADTDMVVFLKPSCAVCGPFDPILHTKYTKKLDWEAELGIVIGKKGKYITKDTAKDYIFGYTCIDDLSERYLQLETPDKQYTKGKGFDNSAPLGPYLVTKDDVPDSSDLHVQLWVNGALRQNFNTGDYIHNDEAVVSYLSQYFTLYPGDIISMGSAPGSANSWGQNTFLKPNDKVVMSIGGFGQQEQVVVVE